MVTHHLLDCLAAAAALIRRRGPVAERVLDVGSGAGLPGVVIAMVSPERSVVCVESVGKKAAFITQASGSLGLKNLVARQERVENLRAPPFDVIASRGFASLSTFVADTRHLLAEQGVWMAMKGKTPETELASLDQVTAEIEPLRVPGLAAERCLVWLVSKPEASTRLSEYS
jgi:16S rRNA (guanine527-N7)-methyltransferase